MNTFYLQVQPDGTITDAIEYPYKDYVAVELASLPNGILGGWFKYENGVVVEYPNLKPTEGTSDKLIASILVEVDNRMAHIKSKTELYLALDKENASLESVREAKYYALKEACDNAILGGFHSPSIKAVFGFKETDQMNMTQQMILFFINDKPVMWKTEDKGIIELTKEQFIVLAFEAQTHKLAQIDKWRGLSVQVQSAKTKEEIITMEW